MCMLQMLATLAADPVASLVDTAYIGHLGEQQALLVRGPARPPQPGQCWQSCCLCSVKLLRRCSRAPP
jgi:hypothetical protein